MIICEELLRSNSRNSERHVSPAIQQLISNQAKRELSGILSLRTLRCEQCTKTNQKVAGANKSLAILQPPATAIKIEVLYWAARLCTTDKETLPIAKQLREDLLQSSDQKDLSILDALLAEKDGDEEKALRLLRDCSDPDSRSVWLGLMDRLKGEKAAWDWTRKQELAGYKLVSGLSVGITGAFSRRSWKSGKKRANVSPGWSLSGRTCPDLRCLEGIINSAMLLPADSRKQVLNDISFAGGSPNQDTAALHHHSRATRCFEFVGHWLEEHGEVDPAWTKAISDCHLWLRLMNPRRERDQTARQEVRRRMSKGEDAVNAIGFALVFNISFDERPLKKYLEPEKGVRRPGGIAKCWRSAFATSHA